MTDQEWSDYYDQACEAAGRITAPETRICMHVVLQMLAHLKAAQHQSPKDANIG